MSTPREYLESAESKDRHAQFVVLKLLGHDHFCALGIVYTPGFKCWCECPLFLRHWRETSPFVPREGAP